MKDLDAAHATGDTDEMRLVAWRGRDAMGQPMLMTRQTVTFLVNPPDGQNSGLAVVRPLGGHGLAVLGYLTEGHVQKTAGIQTDGDWMEIRHGKAALRLNVDGRIRINGTDLRLEAQGTCALDAAEILLN